MEEDGVLIWFAYAMAIGTSIYLFIIMSVLEHAAVKLYLLTEHWFQK